MKIDLPITYSQMDTKWGGILLGNNTSAPYNIKNYGCLITCLAMISCYFGKQESPLSINNELKNVGGFVSGGSYVYSSLTRIFPDISERRVMTSSLLTDAQINEMKSAIDQGFPVMIQLDYNPITVANDMHFVVIFGYNPNDENDFAIVDPIDGKVKSLKAYLHDTKPSARKTIEQYLIYKGPLPHVIENISPIVNVTTSTPMVEKSQLDDLRKEFSEYIGNTGQVIKDLTSQKEEAQKKVAELQQQLQEAQAQNGLLLAQSSGAQALRQALRAFLGI